MSTSPRRRRSHDVERVDFVRYLLDTNVVSEPRKGRKANGELMAWLDSLDRTETCTSVLVLAELRRGIHLVERKDPLQADSYHGWYAYVRAGFADRILGIDEETAEIWARITVPDPLPRFDSLIAATALRHGLIVATRNVSDFARTGVEVFNPFSS